MEKVVRVGMMPGRIEEFAISTGTPVSDVLSMAGLNPSGYDVKVDGVKVTDLSFPVAENTNLILLAKQVKGNADKTIRVGMMPGRISEYAVEIGTPISDILSMASLDPSGYDVKVDGVKIDNYSTPITENTNLILLAKQVKGN